MKGAVVILSGGLDSTVLAYHMKQKYNPLYAISFNYGQTHSKELNYAQLTSEKLKIPFTIIKIPNIFEGSSLTNNNIEIPDGYYEEESMKSTVVPNRNSIFINLAIAFAISKKVDVVGYGAHSGDHAIYPDCRPIFLEKIQELAKVVDYNPIEIYAPFMNMRKQEVVGAGIELKVNFNQTWSCYKGRAIHCGVCGTCTERKEAFEKAEVEDPTEYEIV